MKFIFTTLFALFYGFAFSQQQQFPVNEQGKYILYEVVDSIKVSKDSLMPRAKYFVNMQKKKSMKLTAFTDTSLNAEGKLIVDKTILVAGHPSGELNCHFVFEARERKYRFWLTDFTYIPYQRDRYGNYVPSTTIGTPLEQNPDKLSAAAWKDIVESAYKKAGLFAAEFKKAMATQIHAEPVKKTEKISTKNW